MASWRLAGLSVQPVIKVGHRGPVPAPLNALRVWRETELRTDWFFREWRAYSWRLFAAHVKLRVGQQFLSLAAAFALPDVVSLSAAAPEPDHAGVEFFEKKIRPVFVEHCYKCHSKDADKVKGGFAAICKQHHIITSSHHHIIIPSLPLEPRLFSSRP